MLWALGLSATVGLIVIVLVVRAAVARASEEIRKEDS